MDTTATTDAERLEAGRTRRRNLLAAAQPATTEQLAAAKSLQAAGTARRGQASVNAPRASLLDLLDAPATEVKAAQAAMTFPWAIASVDVNRRPAQPLAVGNLVMIYSRGNYRQAVVEKIGPKLCHVVYTTPTSVAEGFRFGYALTFTRKAIPLVNVFQPLGG